MLNTYSITFYDDPDFTSIRQNDNNFQVISPVISDFLFSSTESSELKNNYLNGLPSDNTVYAKILVFNDYNNSDVINAISDKYKLTIYFTSTGKILYSSVILLQRNENCSIYTTSLKVSDLIDEGLLIFTLTYAGNFSMEIPIEIDILNTASTTISMSGTTQYYISSNSPINGNSLENISFLLSDSQYSASTEYNFQNFVLPTTLPVFNSENTLFQLNGDLFVILLNVLSTTEIPDYISVTFSHSSLLVNPENIYAQCIINDFISTESCQIFQNSSDSSFYNALFDLRNISISNIGKILITLKFDFIGDIQVAYCGLNREAVELNTFSSFSAASHFLSDNYTRDINGEKISIHTTPGKVLYSTENFAIADSILNLKNQDLISLHFDNFSAVIPSSFSVLTQDNIISCMLIKKGDVIQTFFGKQKVKGVRYLPTSNYVTIEPRGRCDYVLNDIIVRSPLVVENFERDIIEHTKSNFAININSYLVSLFSNDDFYYSQEYFYDEFFNFNFKNFYVKNFDISLVIDCHSVVTVNSRYKQNISAGKNALSISSANLQNDLLEIKSGSKFIVKNILIRCHTL